MGLIRSLRERRAEKQADRRAVAEAMQQSRRAGDEQSPEELEAAADRATSLFPNPQ